MTSKGAYYDLFVAFSIAIISVSGFFGFEWICMHKPVIFIIAGALIYKACSFLFVGLIVAALIKYVFSD